MVKRLLPMGVIVILGLITSCAKTPPSPSPQASPELPTVTVPTDNAKQKANDIQSSQIARTS